MDKLHVGDKLYSLVWEQDGTQSIWEEEITSIRYVSHNKIAYYMTKSSAYTPSEIGINVYLKKDEAISAGCGSREFLGNWR